MAATESYNGTSWTSVSSMNTQRRDFGGAGVSNTSALAVSGQTNPDGYTANVESWGGSSWTEIANVNTGRRGGGTSGTQTSALISGGSQEGGAGTVASTEAWNGSSWTEVADLNTARSPSQASGSSNSAQLNVKSPAVEQYNGSSWTAVANLNTARSPVGMAGTKYICSWCGWSFRFCVNRIMEWFSLDRNRRFKYRKKWFTRCRYSNGSGCFWRWPRSSNRGIYWKCCDCCYIYRFLNLVIIFK